VYWGGAIFVAEIQEKNYLKKNSIKIIIQTRNQPEILRSDFWGR